jgi:hypothetical protein
VTEVGRLLHTVVGRSMKGLSYESLERSLVAVVTKIAWYRKRKEVCPTGRNSRLLHYIHPDATSSAASLQDPTNPGHQPFYRS